MMFVSIFVSIFVLMFVLMFVLVFVLVFEPFGCNQPFVDGRRNKLAVPVPPVPIPVAWLVVGGCCGAPVSLLHGASIQARARGQSIVYPPQAKYRCYEC